MALLWLIVWHKDNIWLRFMKKQKNASINEMIKLRRYTKLAAALNILETKSITLLNPVTRDDRNDSHFMAEYKKVKKFDTTLAVCFTEAIDTYHHWYVFSHGTEGVRIDFDKDKLINAFEKFENTRHGAVKYMRVVDLKNDKDLTAADLPFLKRLPYKAEREYRFIYEAQGNVENFKNFPIQLDWIDRITLSPWMPKSIRPAIRNTIKGIDGCSHIKVVCSTLIMNDQWQSLTSHLVGEHRDCRD